MSPRFLFLICTLLLTTAASAEPTIFIDGGCGSATVPIRATNATDVGACDITVTYDPAVVNVTGVTAGDMDVVIQNIEHVTDGWVRIAAYQAGSSGLSGQFVIANIELEPNAAEGTCSLNLSVTTLADDDPDHDYLDYIVENGSYDVVCPIIPQKRRGGGGGGGGTYPPETVSTIIADIMETPIEDTPDMVSVTETPIDVVTTPVIPSIVEVKPESAPFARLWIVLLLTIVGFVAGYLLLRNKNK